MSFLETRFPEKIFIGTSAEIRFLTDVVRTSGGIDERDAKWSVDLRVWDITKAVLTETEYEELMHFFLAVAQGQANGFRLKDRGDYQAVDNQAQSYPVLGVGDGSTATYQLKKSYRYFTASLDRDIKKPVDGTVKIYLDGDYIVPGHATLGWSVDTTTGIVTPDSVANWNGKLIEADFEFDWPVRFNTDSLSMSWLDFNKRRARVQLIEDRNLT